MGGAKWLLRRWLGCYDRTRQLAATGGQLRRCFVWSMSEGLSLGSFDQFDLVAYLAPGAIVLIGLAVAFNAPKPPYGDATLAVAFVFLAYAVGHIVTSMGGVLQYTLRRLFRKRVPKWPLPHIGEDQLPRFKSLITVRLSRNDPAKLFPDDARRFGHLARQLYADVAANGRAGRIDVYNRLGSFYRGMTVSLLVISIGFVYHLSLLGGSTESRRELSVTTVLCLVLAYGTYVQSQRFRSYYNTELLEQFLLLPIVDPDDREYHTSPLTARLKSIKQRVADPRDLSKPQE